MRASRSGSGSEASLVLVLHAGPEDSVQRAVARVAALDDVRGEPVVLRVLGTGAGGEG